MLMRAYPVLLLLLTVPALAAGRCDSADDIIAVHAAALQQEMMVAAFQCADVAAYNDFVIAHQAALQSSDRSLMAYFERSDPVRAFDAYNLYKTELANAASLRFTRDRTFCARVKANFRAASGRSLDQALLLVPYPVDTGSVFCPWATAPQPVATSPQTPPKKRVRHRTWLGRLVDWLFH
jgi:hypothetical protein